MKKILITIIALSGLLVACEDALVRGELFEKKVLINQNGFREYELNYFKAQNSTVDTTFCVAVSGTTDSDKDVTVTLDINADTLAGYNWDKFRNDKSRYYELLPEECYTMQTEGITIKAGDEYAEVPVTFHLDKFDKSKNYVLPVSIVSASEYTLAGSKFCTILMNAVLSNEYSGSFSLSGRIKEVEINESIDIRMTRTLRAEEKNSISLYAGNIAENKSNREDYRIMVTVNPDSSLSVTAVNPDKIEIKSVDTPNLDIENPVNKLTVRKRTDAQNSHKVYVTTTFSLFYNYIDKTNPDDPIEMRWEGSANRTKTERITVIEEENPEENPDVTPEENPENRQ